MRIEIICTGDEVLTGRIVNTNFSYMTQRLEDVGLSVKWETTVGDDRESLLHAFKQAGERADAVIVNGGLGPTVDDLSQEIAAQAAGVELVLSEDWLTRMEDFFSRRSRVMPPNNRKQAMLPATAEMIDNPIGTACGFAVDIGKARFFFTPGVPRELKRMLEEQVIPRLLARSGLSTTIHLKRFHSYGLGESHVDSLLTGVDALVPDGSVKLGFRAHYPQLETKLTVRGTDMSDVRKKLEPVEREVRKRLGNFILAEDDHTLEGVVLGALAARQGSLSIVETFTGGQIAARVAHLPGAEKIFRRGIVARELGEVCAAVGLDGAAAAGGITRETAEVVARIDFEKVGGGAAWPTKRCSRRPSTCAGTRTTRSTPTSRARSPAGVTRAWSSSTTCRAGTARPRRSRAGSPTRATWRSRRTSTSARARPRPRRTARASARPAACRTIARWVTCRAPSTTCARCRT